MKAPLDVLVVDDEPVVRDAVLRVLAAQGLRVTCVDSAEAALRQVGRTEFALVVCDVMLPHMSGLELIGALHERVPATAILAITGYATGDVAAQAVAAGASAFLPKPFDPEELSDQVRHVLAGARRAVKEDAS